MTNEPFHNDACPVKNYIPDKLFSHFVLVVLTKLCFRYVVPSIKRRGIAIKLDENGP